MSKQEALEVLADLSSEQWGLATAAQAARRGVTQTHLTRLQKDGVIRKVRYGVYSLPGAPATWLEDVRAEWLATDPARTLGERFRDEEGAVIADETAARIYGFGDFSGAGIRMSSPKRIQIERPYVKVATRQMSPREWSLVDGLPVTTPRRTLEDLVRSGRWEEQHLADALDDAMRLDLITREDVAKSKPLMRIAPDLAPPASHMGVLTLLRQDATKRGMEPQAWQDNFFRFQFARALMEKEDGWVIKGGSGIMCRFGDARDTQDIDLFRDGSDNHVVSAQELAALMDGVVVGQYTFECEYDPKAERERGLSSAVKVRVYAGSREVRRFSIDVSDRIRLDQGPDTIVAHRPDSAVIKGYPSRGVVRLYPVENQIADKIGAMYSKYGGGAAASTRYHDLYDIALLADRVDVGPDALRAALLAKERRMGGARLPHRLVAPSPEWPDNYERAMRKMANVLAPYTNYDAAMQIASAVADPVLGEIAAQRGRLRVAKTEVDLGAALDADRGRLDG